MRYFRARTRSRRFLLVCGAVSVVVLGGSAIAYAAGAIPGPNGVIQGCYAPQDNYSLRVTSTTCPKGTVPLSWNQQGPKGNPGTNGTNGTNGFNSLTKTTSEPAGANCASGGQKIETGLDNGDGGGSANDGVLQAGEVDSTSYVCNGAKGDPGTPTFFLVGNNQHTGGFFVGGFFFAGCQDQTSGDGYSIGFTNTGGARWWVDTNGSVSSGTGDVIPANGVSGDNHYVIRITDGSSTGVWDIFAHTESGTCQMSITQQVAANSPNT